MAPHQPEGYPPKPRLFWEIASTNHQNARISGQSAEPQLSSDSVSRNRRLGSPKSYSRQAVTETTRIELPKQVGGSRSIPSTRFPQHFPRAHTANQHQ